MALLRIDKILADTGKASRKEAKSLIKSGRVSCDGVVVSSPEQKFDSERAEIRLDGELIEHKRFRYIIMNKPGGVLSATEDASQETVIDLLPKDLQKQGLFPVGRLDKDTTGLLLLTNDGDYSHRVITPKKHVPKCYRAAVSGVLEEADVRAFEEGIGLADGTQCMPAQLKILRPSVGEVIIFEGKYHQVKRMFASRGKHVTALHRESIGALKLPKDLKPGEYRELDDSEKELVFE